MISTIRRRAASIVLTLTSAAFLASSAWLFVPSAHAKLGFGGGCGGTFCFFASPAALRTDGRELTLTGHITCDANVQGWKLHLSATQESTTASARAVITDACVEGEIPFAAQLEVPGGAPAFEPGKALACGMLLTGEGANIAHGGFWCRFIEIRVP